MGRQIHEQVPYLPLGSHCHLFLLLETQWPHAKFFFFSYMPNLFSSVLNMRTKLYCLVYRSYKPEFGWFNETKVFGFAFKICVQLPAWLYLLVSDIGNNLGVAY